MSNVTHRPVSGSDGPGADQEGDRVDKHLEELSHDRAAAELRGDTAFLERTLAGDFVAIGPRGFMLTKEEWLERHRTGDLRYQSFTWDEVAVRVYGDAAVVTGRETTRATYKGQPIQGQFRTTLIFVQQDGDWRLAGLQLSPIMGAP
jgi:ketosteroid isomerase-like protein